MRTDLFDIDDLLEILKDDVKVSKVDQKKVNVVKEVMEEVKEEVKEVKMEDPKDVMELEVEVVEVEEVKVEVEEVKVVDPKVVEESVKENGELNYSNLFGIDFSGDKGPGFVMMKKEAVVEESMPVVYLERIDNHRSKGLTNEPKVSAEKKEVNDMVGAIVPVDDAIFPNNTTDDSVANIKEEVTPEISTNTSTTDDSIFPTHTTAEEIKEDETAEISTNNEKTKEISTKPLSGGGFLIPKSSVLTIQMIDERNAEELKSPPPKNVSQNSNNLQGSEVSNINTVIPNTGENRTNTLPSDSDQGETTLKHGTTNGPIQRLIHSAPSNNRKFLTKSTSGRSVSNFLPDMFDDGSPEYEVNEIEGVRKDRVEDGLVYFSKNFQILLKGGTKEKIIEKIIVEKTDLQQDLLKIFLLTYRSIFTPTELLDQFISIFLHLYYELEIEEDTQEEAKMIFAHTIEILRNWVTDHYFDFSDDPLLYNNFIQKVTDSLSSIDPVANKLIQDLEEAKIKFENRSKWETVFDFPPPHPISPKKKKFEDFDALELARQLCLFEQRLFMDIHPIELLDLNWSKNPQNSPNLIQMITFFNNLSRGLASLICNTDDSRLRGKLIEKLFKTSNYLTEFNNFNSAMAIVACLNSSGVHRLRISWYHAQRREKVFEAFQQVEETLSSDSAYKNIRSAVKSATPPIIPYIGVYLTDLTFIEDGNGNRLVTEHVRDDIINFDKMRKVATIIESIQKMQEKPYHFEIVPIIQFYLEGILQGVGCQQTEDEDFQKSRELESKEKIQIFMDKKKVDATRTGSLRSSRKKKKISISSSTYDKNKN